ncbi:TrmH family RNA methyltransferase [Labilibacter marinus]|uniref:TrmH family RNA methyltransferase n=1 Tax=Labilibacter marinus TaxID=1477105 RepID=UPI00082BEC0E|nr:RNA methyltransferase [Labilibacter marinus]
MINQNKIKLISSLNKKKYREQHQLFIAEGEKLVLDLINSKLNISEVFIRDNWNGNKIIPTGITTTHTTEQYLKKISQLKTAPPIIALCSMPKKNLADINFSNDLCIALDDIQDPGNLGTIIRLADWFGIKNIVCSQNTVDVYNPKVIQATMGAIARVNIHYTDIEELLIEQQKQQVPIYGTFLDGEDIYSNKLSPSGIIVMGNEGKGISPAIEQYVDSKLLIPSFSTNLDKSESLNVSTATAITLSEFKRRI